MITLGMLWVTAKSNKNTPEWLYACAIILDAWGIFVAGYAAECFSK